MAKCYSRANMLDFKLENFDFKLKNRKLLSISLTPVRTFIHSKQFAFMEGCFEYFHCIVTFGACELMDIELLLQ